MSHQGTTHSSTSHHHQSSSTASHHRDTYRFNEARISDEAEDEESATHAVSTSATDTTPTGPLGQLQQFMFDELRAPKDTMADATRKIVIAWGLPLALLPFSFMLYMTAEVMMNGMTVGGLVAMLAMMLFTLMWLAANMYVRLTRRCPETVVDAWLFCTIAGVFMLTLALVEYPSTLIVFFLAALVFLCDTPRKPVQLLLCGAIYLLAAINNAAAGLNQSNHSFEMGILPDAYWGTATERLVYQASTLVIAAVIASSLQMQSKERARASLAEMAAARFARRVADQLICFNTDAAIEELRALRVQGYDDDGNYIPYKQRNTSGDEDSPGGAPPDSPGNRVSPQLRAADVSVESDPDVRNQSFASDLVTDLPPPPAGAASAHDDGPGGASDPSAAAAASQDPSVLVSVDFRLIESFELLINHFEMFRPHLPTWLLSTAVHQGDRIAEEHMREATDADLISLDESACLETQGSASNTPRGGSGHKYSLDTGHLNAMSGGGNGRGRVSPQVSPGPSALVGHHPGSMRRLHQPRSPHAQRLSDTHMPPGVKPKAVKVSVAWVDFSRAGLADVSNQGTTLDSLSMLVDLVHEAVDNTLGAVHSFVGDSVLATWNTVRQCAQVECKAARFLAAIRDATSNEGFGITSCGIAMTGDAHVQLAGLNHRQHALTVWMGPWRQALRQLASFSRQVNGLIIDEPTYNAANFTVECRVVDFVTVTKCAAGGFASNRASPAPSPLLPRFSLMAVDGTNAMAVMQQMKAIRLPGAASSNTSPSAGGHGAATASPTTASFNSPDSVRTMQVFEVVRDLNTSSVTQRKTAGSNLVVHGGPLTASMEHHEEWMYTLARTERETNVAVHEALQAAQIGNYAIARDMLEAALRKEANQRDAASRTQSVGSSFGKASSAATPHGRSPQMSLNGTVTGSGNAKSANGGDTTTASSGGPGVLDSGIHMASATLPPSVSPLQRRLLFKLETCAAADPPPPWSAFPEDLTPIF